MNEEPDVTPREAPGVCMLRLLADAFPHLTTDDLDVDSFLHVRVAPPPPPVVSADDFWGVLAGTARAEFGASARPLDVDHPEVEELTR